MTRELLERKYPIDTRIKIKENDFLFGAAECLGTVIEIDSFGSLVVKMDNGGVTYVTPGQDKFSVVYGR